jgi:DNA (cytosine-5)-methyltransferase 1
MTHGSLFSGIGGFDLASEWMGWENKFHCEWNEFGQKVLNYYWPEAELFIDIKKSDFTKYANKIDILTGGFPCQPYSSAGKRLGKEDDRHLWPEMLRAIREISPRWVVGENVRGLTNWNGGLVFDEVQADLETQGYEVLPFLLPACAVNAPHRRDRIWFIAYSNHERGSAGLGKVQGEDGKVSKWNNNAKSCDTGNEYATNTECIGLHRQENEQELEGTGVNKLHIGESRNQSDAADTTNIRRKDALENGELEGKRFRQSYQRNAWNSFPSVSPICNGDDGLSNRLDNITFPKWRNESIKAGGNAIVPQVVYQIFKSIEEYERINNSRQDC